MDIYRMHVTLRDIEPPIWRKVELPARTTLKQFHRILQISMGWGNYHLHEFRASGKRYREPDPDDDPLSEITPENGVRLSSICTESNKEIVYLYDFGDYWEHCVRLEAVIPSEPGMRYPRVIGGARSCPPEDSGGKGGYGRLLEILMDPKHDDFDFMREWAGTSFNAEVFSVDEVNERLRKIR